MLHNNTQLPFLSVYLQKYIISIISNYINNEIKRIEYPIIDEKDIKINYNEIKKLILSISLTNWNWFNQLSNNLNVSLDYECLKNINNNNNNDKFKILKLNNIITLKISKFIFSKINPSKMIISTITNSMDSFLKTLRNNIKFFKNLKEIYIENVNPFPNLKGIEQYEDNLLSDLINGISGSENDNDNINIGLSVLTPSMISNSFNDDIKRLIFIDTIVTINLYSSQYIRSDQNTCFPINEFKLILNNQININSIVASNISDLQIRQFIKLKEQSNIYYYKYIKNLLIIDQIYQIKHITSILKLMPNLKSLKFSICFKMFNYYFNLLKSNSNSETTITADDSECSCCEVNDDEIDEFLKSWEFINQHLANSEITRISIINKCDVTGNDLNKRILSINLKLTSNLIKTLNLSTNLKTKSKNNEIKIKKQFK